jgi:ankyrin repeat protein
MDPVVLLALARDNKAAELAAVLKAGVPPGLGNKVRQRARLRVVLWCCMRRELRAWLSAARLAAPAPPQMGQTALHVAALWGNKEAVAVLLEHGADVNQMNSRQVLGGWGRAGVGASGRLGQRICAQQQQRHPEPACTAAELEAPATTLAHSQIHSRPAHTHALAHTRTHRGSTPLHFAAAAKRDALAVCTLLLRAGADAGHPDHHGYLPFEQAESPEVRVLLGGPDQRLFDYAGAPGRGGRVCVCVCGERGRHTHTHTQIRLCVPRRGGGAYGPRPHLRSSTHQHAPRRHALNTVSGKVGELRELLATEAAVPSLKVVDAEGAHVLNLAIQHQQQEVVQVSAGW